MSTGCDFSGGVELASTSHGGLKMLAEYESRAAPAPA